MTLFDSNTSYNLCYFQFSIDAVSACSVATMTSRLTRPRRTKMYDCNYRMGERNYRPVLDDLDRKYSGRGGGGGEGGLSTLRGALAEAEAALPHSTRRDATPVESAERRRPLSTLLDDDDDDSFFDVAAKKTAARRQAMRSLEDGFDRDLETSSGSRRVRDSRRRIAALEEEIAGRRSGGGVDFADKVLDSVGLSGEDVSKARQYLQQRRKVTVTSSSAAALEDDDASAKAMTKWTKLADKEVDVGVGGGAAAARARKSRARLQDLESEMEELADRAAARERRSANVRALLQETAEVGSASSVQAGSTTVRVRKVAAAVDATEKTVSF